MIMVHPAPGGTMAAVSRTVVVTGATGGIGSAVVRALVGRGDRVVAVGRSTGRLAELAELGAVTPLAVDLTRRLDPPHALVERERLDGLVHCAGIAEVASVEDTPDELWHETLDVNLIAAAGLTRALLPALRATAGRVVFVNAAPGLHAVPRWSAYTASKAAMRELADSLREEEPRLRVTTIYPGGTATELLRRVREQFGRPYDPEACLRPETVASLVLAVLDFPPDAHITDLSVRAAKL
jgi:NADP-dependent 3-hydroxy acid dehydrogenase YdfG